MNKRRILVAADVTNGRDAAFERGLAIARTSGAELYILHAVPANQPFSVGATERLRRTAEFRNRAEQMGVTLQAVEQHGDPAEIIELHANARDVDLIVMGAERHRRPKWLRRSSITERVMRRSKKPTLVVPNDDAGSDFENVLVAVDLSPESKSVVEQAMQLAGDDSPRFTIVHAVKASKRRKPSRALRDGWCPSTERIFSKTHDASWRQSSTNCRHRLTHESNSRPARHLTRL